MKFFLPGEKVCELGENIKGHGTQIYEGNILSTYFGPKKIINKLVTVEPRTHFKYSPEVGDIIIGRVSSVYNKKWKIEMNCKYDSTLKLSAINLPGVVQRRKLESDEISMRSFFDIGDLLVAEVQKVSKSGSVSLHTRNEKYKKLENGILVFVPIDLMSNFNAHFLDFKDIYIIIGSNGYVFVSILSDDVSAKHKAVDIVSSIRERVKNSEMIDLKNIY